jgi:hypothetical protein
MKKITKTYEVFKFEELSQKAKDKARTNFNEGNGYEFLTEFLTEILYDQLKKYKIFYNKDCKVQCSLSRCQGDGAMFTGSFDWGKYTITITHLGRYYHSNSKIILISDESGEYASEKVSEKFEKIYQNICSVLENDGYKYIEHEDSEEHMQNMCDANDYTFLSDGTMFNE